MEKHKKLSYNNNKFKISAPTSNDEFKLPGGSYSISDIPDYLRIYINQIENRITFKIKTGYYLELLTTETMKLLESTENKITRDQNGESLPHLEITELVLVHCNIVNNDYQQDLDVH